MDPGSSPSSSQRAPFEVHSIHFSFPGSPAIGLKDPATDDYVSIAPEWTANPPRDEPAAYVRGVRPPLWVVFRGSPAADGTYTIGGAGALVEVDEGSVSLTFDAHSGLSAPIRFQAKSPLPDRIGRHSARFDWYVCDPVDRNVRLSAGSSSHTICTAWRAMRPDPTGQGRLHNWAYKPLMEWTCEWAAGQDDEKSICDAIIGNLRRSGLQYGIRGYDVREVLQQKGGMCQGWYHTFQQMAHCQGVFVHCRRFLVDWRQMPNGQEQWCALVIRSGGLNQAQPAHPESEFHDNDTAFPIIVPVALQRRRERRYRFWGHPGWYDDGHCINFLEYRGRLYLYDACFGTGPFEIDPPLPPDDLSVVGGADLTSFKVRYLDTAVDYMLGTLYNGTVLHQTIRRGLNGMTVKTALIPETVGGTAGLTFRWGP